MDAGQRESAPKPVESPSPAPSRNLAQLSGKLLLGGLSALVVLIAAVFVGREAFDGANQYVVARSMTWKVILLALMLAPMFGVGEWLRRRIRSGRRLSPILVGVFGAAAFSSMLLLPHGLAWLNSSLATAKPFEGECLFLRSERRNHEIVVRLVAGSVRDEFKVPLVQEIDAPLVPGVTHLGLQFRTGGLGWTYMTRIRVLPLPQGATTEARPPPTEPFAGNGRRPIRLEWLMLWATAGLLAIAAGSALIAFLVARLTNRSLGKQALGADVRGFGFAGARSGLEFHYVEGWLRLPPPMAASLTAQKRNETQWLAERLRFCKPVSSGDVDFDHQVAVESSPPEAARMLVSIPEARPILIDLLNQGKPRHVLRLDERSLRVPCPLNRTTAATAGRTVDQLIALHEIMATRVRPAVGASQMFPRWWMPLCKAILLALVLVAGPNILVLTVSGLGESGGHALGAASVWTLALTIPATCVVLLVLRLRRSGSGAAAMAILLTPLLGGFVLVPVVMFIDRSAPSKERVITAHLRGFDGYSAKFAPLEGIETEPFINVAPPGLDDVTPPCDVRLHVGESPLGFIWVIRIEPAER